MTYTWDEIKENWLVGGQVAVSPDEVTRAFNTVAARFGRGWVEASRMHGGVVTRGTTDVLYVVTLGQMFEVLGNAPNAEGLFEKVRKNDSDARAEMTAAYLVRKDNASATIEFEPRVMVGRRSRKPDFRVQRNQSLGSTLRSPSQEGQVRKSMCCKTLKG